MPSAFCIDQIVPFFDIYYLNYQTGYADFWFLKMVLNMRNGLLKEFFIVSIKDIKQVKVNFWLTKVLICNLKFQYCKLSIYLLSQLYLLPHHSHMQRIFSYHKFWKMGKNRSIHQNYESQATFLYLDSYNFNYMTAYLLG